MALKAKKDKIYTPEEYLILDRKAEEKSEYYEGKIIKRADSSIDHVRIMTNILRELKSFEESKKNEFLSCGLKVKNFDSNYFFYPDLLGLPENPIFHDEEKDVIANPKVIFEIYSKESRYFDRGDKFIAYQKFQSVTEIVLINQHKPIVEKFFRLDDKYWDYKFAVGLDNSIKFDSVEAKLKLRKIYHRVKVSKNIYERNKWTS